MRKIVTVPTEEPVSTAEAKLYLKVDVTDDDVLIAEIIKTARLAAEIYTGRQLCTATWEEYLDEFADLIELYKCPVDTVTFIKYYDTDGELQTLSDTKYTVDAVSEPSRISNAPNESFPSTQDRLNAVVIRYVSGYGDADDVPEPFKEAIKLMVGHLYENRQDVTKENMNELPMGAKHLLNYYRVH